MLSCRFAERKVRRAPCVLRMAVVSQSSVKFGKKRVFLVGKINFMNSSAVNFAQILSTDEGGLCLITRNNFGSTDGYFVFLINICCSLSLALKLNLPCPYV